MNNKLTLGARFTLGLSLAIASSLVAHVANAESRLERQANEDLSRTITQLVDLGAERQWLVEAAMSRAATVQGNRQVNVTMGRRQVTAGVPRLPEPNSRQRR